MADIGGMEGVHYKLPMWCEACGGITTHLVVRTMPYQTPNGLRVTVFYTCQRCDIKLASRRDTSIHEDVWTVENFNSCYHYTWVGGNQVLKLEHVKRKTSHEG